MVMGIGKSLIAAAKTAKTAQGVTAPAKAAGTATAQAAGKPVFSPLSGEAAEALRRSKLAEAQARAARPAPSPTPDAKPNWEDLREEDFMRRSYGLPPKER